MDGYVIGSPPFISHDLGTAIWKGSHVARSLGDETDHHGQIALRIPYFPGTTFPNDCITQMNDILGCPGTEVRINGLFHLLINGVYWGYNPLTNH